MFLSWYEQKAVCILLTLLHLGIKNIFLGSTLPAFISPNILNILVEKYNIMPISTPDENLKKYCSKNNKIVFITEKDSKKLSFFYIIMLVNNIIRSCIKSSKYNLIVIIYKIQV